MSIRIITDSGCDISQKEAKEKGIVDQIIGSDCKLDDII